ncbi:hypothetical protein N9X21_04250 [Candidatus Pelagibacter bacterium]|nr:hypothetical protein [Candidatus Pelagibacter bacterium]
MTLKKVTLLDIKIIHNLFNEAVENNFFITKKNKFSKYFFLKNGYKLINIKKKFKNEFNKKNLIFINKLKFN